MIGSKSTCTHSHCAEPPLNYVVVLPRLYLHRHLDKCHLDFGVTRVYPNNSIPGISKITNV